MTKAPTCVEFLPDKSLNEVVQLLLSHPLEDVAELQGAGSGGISLPHAVQCVLCSSRALLPCSDAGDNDPQQMLQNCRWARVCQQPAACVHSSHTGSACRHAHHPSSSSSDAACRGPLATFGWLAGSSAQVAGAASQSESQVQQGTVHAVSAAVVPCSTSPRLISACPPV